MSSVTGSDQFQHELTLLADRVAALEQQLAYSPNAETDASLESVMPVVRQITQELFPGECEFTEEFDPEFPHDRYTVVNVEATGDLKEIANRGCVWDERIRQLSGQLFGRLRLLITPR